MTNPTDLIARLAATRASRELDAMREWARIGLALYTGAMGAIAMFYPEAAQVPLNQNVVAALKAKEQG